MQTVCVTLHRESQMLFEDVRGHQVLKGQCEPYAAIGSFRGANKYELASERDW